MNIDASLTDLAAEQEGLLTSRPAPAARRVSWDPGVRSRVAGGWMSSGWRHRLYTLRGSPDTHRRRLRCGLLVCAWGAQLGELRSGGPPATASIDPVHTLSSSTIERPRRPAVLPFAVHTTKRLDPIDHVVADGFRAASATRTVFDLALARAHPQRI